MITFVVFMEKKYRILVIDDDSSIRSSLGFLLKRAGYEVEAVSGPEEALRSVRATSPDVILMDMNFSLSTTGEEGLVLLRQVKIFQPQVPVILIGEVFSWLCRACKPVHSIS